MGQQLTVDLSMDVLAGEYCMVLLPVSKREYNVSSPSFNQNRVVELNHSGRVERRVKS